MQDKSITEIADSVLFRVNLHFQGSLSNLFFLPSKKGSTQKGKNLLPKGEQILSI